MRNSELAHEALRKYHELAKKTGHADSEEYAVLKELLHRTEELEGMTDNINKETEPKVRTSSELDLLNLKDQLLKLHDERFQQYEKEGYLVYELDNEEIFRLDDGDNLIQGIDILIKAIDGMLEKKNAESN